MRKCTSTDLILSWQPGALSMSTDSMNNRQFPISLPFLKLEPLLLSKKTELYIGVIVVAEVPPEGSSGSLHNHCAYLQGGVDISGISTA